MRAHILKIVLLISGLSVMLSSCATTQADYDQAVQRVIVSALTSPLSEIESRADAGDGQAQYELSIIYVFGLRGKAKDMDMASRYRTQAMEQRGREDVQRYQGASSTNAGGMVMRSEPKFSWVRSHSQNINKCTIALSNDSRDAEQSCIGERPVSELKMLWEQARAE
ncbi:hypothetical protein [Asticcacaulis benevestitus]|uniref:Uncharacterized protein n=1 Tax=Asticcacaulis benevestitus DSM 16100 = ATCC BAA-896 TaxID=1121022 RepID=V4PKP9_9CAUL|nr:hypothetical protein [Asticcacaulis benevestitus]ESQ87829.1 hypothetical protein ABENE_16890 [Asticcacaulis benevestitus DSM 16100 = ATCC BAA-896]